MYNAFLQRTKQTISSLCKHIQTSDRFRTAVFDDSLNCKRGAPCFDPAIAELEAVPDRLEWRVIDHCAAVTRIYAIYEQFVHEMIREHLNLLQERLSFVEFPERFRASYRQGLSKILEKKDGPRFGDLNLEKLISEYDNALQGKRYSLEPRAMLIQEQNLRFPELGRLLNDCGIDEAANWIRQHAAVQTFFAAEDRISGSAESEMAELIKYRNDAAHGSIDLGSILSVNVLVEFCDFIAVVCEAIAERVQLAGLSLLVKHGYAQKHGTVTEYFHGGMVVVGKVSGRFKVGCTVYLLGHDYCLERSVLSLQIDNITHEEVNLTSVAELGMRFDAPGMKNAIVVSFDPAKGALVADEGQGIEDAIDNTGVPMTG